MEDNYDLDILEWGNVNYPRTFLYDDAQVNVLNEALPFQTNNKSRGIEREKKNPKRRSYDFMDSTKLVQKNQEFVLIVEL